MNSSKFALCCLLMTTAYSSNLKNHLNKQAFVRAQQSTTQGTFQSEPSSQFSPSTQFDLASQFQQQPSASQAQTQTQAQQSMSQMQMDSSIPDIDMNNGQDDQTFSFSDLTYTQISQFLDEQQKELGVQSGFFNGSIFQQEVPLTVDRASCLLASYDGVNNVYGVVNFTQVDPITLHIRAKIYGLEPGTQHGLHVHTYGDVSDKCWGTGGHWNPTNVRHGAPNATPHHYGDLGNILADETGFAEFEYYSNELTLVGPFSIIGRGVNVHQNVDDFGLTDAFYSQNCGNAGGRIACCGITHAPQVFLIPPGLFDA